MKAYHIGLEHRRPDGTLLPGDRGAARLLPHFDNPYKSHTTANSRQSPERSAESPSA